MPLPRALGHPRPRRPLASLAPAAPAAAHLSPRPIKGGTPRPLCPITAPDSQGLGTRRGMNWDGLGGLDGLQPMAIVGSQHGLGTGSLGVLLTPGPAGPPRA